MPAQWQLAADIGTAHLRQSGIPESNAFTFGATADALGERAALRSSMLFSRASTAQATAQGVVVGSVAGPNTTGPNWELTGALSGFRATSATLTTSAEGVARLRFGGSTFGGAIGAGGGTLADRVDRRGLYAAQASAWRTLGVDQLIVDASYVGTTASLVEATKYADVSASWRRDYRGLEFGATAGARAGVAGASSGGWGSADGAVWLAPNVALVVAAGRSLEDVPRGVPRTSYASVAFRVASRSHSAVFDARPASPSQKTLVTRDGVSVRVDGAARVELMADFTDWDVVPLERSADAWRLVRAVPAGLHRVAIRVDGGEWTAPPGLPRTTDDLGGVVGLITVP
ncbi:MAG: glycogen-binding domain-containing protein [Gemmatimonadaceae bacterium]